AAVAKPRNVVYLEKLGRQFWGCFAAQREQAPSPQGLRMISLLVCTAVPAISDHSGRNWLFFVLYSAPAIFHLNTGHRHANSQAVI
ncbi:MAG: hypothetical protein ACRES0_12345, partial [Pseudomonas sp.]